MNEQGITNLFQSLDPPLWIVTARGRSGAGGLLATVVNQASIVPNMPRVTTGISKQHFTHTLIEESESFGLHLLGEEHVDWIWRFGLETGREIDKLEGLKVEKGPCGSPILVDAPGWLDCRVEARLDTGDRTIYLAKIVDGDLRREGRVLTVRDMIRHASPEILARLGEHYQADGEVDAAAIGEWRRQRG